jgi:phenylpyruvate tautomerase PptA (4-oxalocrotonate tautomerase family)
MPTYTVTSANVALTQEQESVIAAAITDAHHGNTGAPAFFAQVLFVTVPAGKHYVGGKPNRTPHLFVNGLIRAGRGADVKAALVKEIAAKVRTIAGIGAEDIWVYLQDIAPQQMVEFGRVLPEPGAEAQWNDGLSATKRAQLIAAGVPL